VIGPVPGNEIVHPMALVIIGALITTTLLILLAVPSLYLWLAPRPQLEAMGTPSLKTSPVVAGAAD